MAVPSCTESNPNGKLLSTIKDVQETIADGSLHSGEPVETVVSDKLSEKVVRIANKKFYEGVLSIFLGPSGAAVGAVISVKELIDRTDSVLPGTLPSPAENLEKEEEVFSLFGLAFLRGACEETYTLDVPGFRGISKVDADLGHAVLQGCRDLIHILAKTNPVSALYGGAPTDFIVRRITSLIDKIPQQTQKTMGLDALAKGLKSQVNGDPKVLLSTLIKGSFDVAKNVYRKIPPAKTDRAGTDTSVRLDPLTRARVALAKATILLDETTQGAPITEAPFQIPKGPKDLGGKDLSSSKDILFSVDVKVPGLVPFGAVDQGKKKTAGSDGVPVQLDPAATDLSGLRAQAEAITGNGEGTTPLVAGTDTPVRFNPLTKAGVVLANAEVLLDQVVNEDSENYTWYGYVPPPPPTPGFFDLFPAEISVTFFTPGEEFKDRARRVAWRRTFGLPPEVKQGYIDEYKKAVEFREKRYRENLIDTDSIISSQKELVKETERAWNEAIERHKRIKDAVRCDLTQGRHEVEVAYLNYLYKRRETLQAGANEISGYLRQNPNVRLFYNDKDECTQNAILSYVSTPELAKRIGCLRSFIHTNRKDRYYCTAANAQIAKLSQELDLRYNTLKSLSKKELSYLVSKTKKLVDEANRNIHKRYCRHLNKNVRDRENELLSRLQAEEDRRRFECTTEQSSRSSLVPIVRGVIKKVKELSAKSLQEGRDSVSAGQEELALASKCMKMADKIDELLEKGAEKITLKKRDGHEEQLTREQAERLSSSLREKQWSETVSGVEDVVLGGAVATVSHSVMSGAKRLGKEFEQAPVTAANALGSNVGSAAVDFLAQGDFTCEALDRKVQEVAVSTIKGVSSQVAERVAFSMFKGAVKEIAPGLVKSMPGLSTIHSVYSVASAAFSAKTWEQGCRNGASAALDTGIMGFWMLAGQTFIPVPFLGTAAGSAAGSIGIKVKNVVTKAMDLGTERTLDSLTWGEKRWHKERVAAHLESLEKMKRVVCQSEVFAGGALRRLAEADGACVYCGILRRRSSPLQELDELDKITNNLRLICAKEQALQDSHSMRTEDYRVEFGEEWTRQEQTYTVLFEREELSSIDDLANIKNSIVETLGQKARSIIGQTQLGQWRCGAAFSRIVKAIPELFTRGIGPRSLSRAALDGLPEARPSDRADSESFKILARYYMREFVLAIHDGPLSEVLQRDEGGKKFRDDLWNAYTVLEGAERSGLAVAEANRKVVEMMAQIHINLLKDELEKLVEKSKAEDARPASSAAAVAPSDSLGGAKADLLALLQGKQIEDETRRYRAISLLPVLDRPPLYASEGPEEATPVEGFDERKWLTARIPQKLFFSAHMSPESCAAFILETDRLGRQAASDDSSKDVIGWLSHLLHVPASESLWGIQKKTESANGQKLHGILFKTPSLFF